MQEVLRYKVETQATMYIVAVLEYIAANILKVSQISIFIICQVILIVLGIYNS